MNPAPAPATERLLAAAKRLFAEKGYDGTSVRDIVAAADVNVSMVSYHFGGKEGLYRACIKTFGETNQAFTRGVLTPPTSVADMRTKLTIFIEGFLRTLVSDVDAQRITVRELDGYTPLFRDLLSEVFRKTFDIIAGFFAAAKARGFLNPNLDPAELASLMNGILNQQQRVDRVRQDWRGQSITEEATLKHVANQITNFALDGLAAR